MNPSISLIITTYNWPDALYLVLTSLLKQSILPDELIIADDGSLEETKSLIANLKNKFDIPYIHLWQEDKGFRKSELLNKAILMAKGDYIIQVDGDVILHKHFIKDHKKNLENNIFLYGSRVTIKESNSKQVLNSKKTSFNYFSKGIKKRNRTLRIPFYNFFSKRRDKNSGKLRGCNLSYWKKDAIAINGYNEGFQGWGYEDYEFAQRLLNKGVLGKRIKHAAIQFHLYHNEAPKGDTTVGDRLLTDTIKNNICFIKEGIVKVNQ